MKIVGRDSHSIVRERAAAWAPASLSNLGPGFDILGVAIDAWGDRIEAVQNSRPGVSISYAADSVWTGTVEPDQNTAGVAAERVLNMLDYEGGVELIIHKNITPGSGVGSSAASAAGAAWAINLLFGSPFEKSELVPAVLEGESVASGSVHGDNAIPSLFGGTVIVSSVDPTRYRRIRVDESLCLSVILPSVQILTRAAREMLPESVSFKDAVHHSSALAMLIDAFKDGDWESVGHYIMQDRIVEPIRSSLLPGYNRIKQSAVDNGAYGCALSGSGPAMFAVSENERMAQDILEAMIQASSDAGIEASGTVAFPDNRGVREWETPETA